MPACAAVAACPLFWGAHGPINHHKHARAAERLVRASVRPHLHLPHMLGTPCIPQCRAGLHPPFGSTAYTTQTQPCMQVRPSSSIKNVFTHACNVFEPFSISIGQQPRHRPVQLSEQFPMSPKSCAIAAAWYCYGLWTRVFNQP